MGHAGERRACPRSFKSRHHPEFYIFAEKLFARVKDDLIIESSADEANVDVSVYLMNWNTSQLDKVDNYRVGTTDEGRIVSNLLGDDYVRSSDGQIEVLVEHKRTFQGGHFQPGFGVIRPIKKMFNSKQDKVQVLVTP